MHVMDLDHPEHELVLLSESFFIFYEYMNTNLAEFTCNI